MLIELKNIYKNFETERGIFSRGKTIAAVRDFSCSVAAGEIVGLVGESGSGKSTIGKIIQGLLEPTEGTVLFHGQDAAGLSRRARAHLVQTIFQDPFASLNPKLSVGVILQEALRQAQVGGSTGGGFCEEGRKMDSGSRAGMTEEELLQAVGLSRDTLDYFPHQFSGGQRQRIGIARCLAMQPQLIIADEPVSALDVSIQAQILNLLVELNRKFKTAFLLITHDLAIVQHCADRLIVLQNGQKAEEGATQNIFKNPQSPYTQKLFSAIPKF